MQAEASLTQETIQQLSPLPDQPTRCGRRVSAGIQPGDRLDVVAVKYDRALGRANTVIGSCYEYNKRIQQGWLGLEKK